MSIKIKIIDQRTKELKDATVLKFEQRNKDAIAIEYELEDGHIIKLMPELLQIASIDGETLPNGDPIYQFGINTKVEIEKKIKDE